MVYFYPLDIFKKAPQNIIKKFFFPLDPLTFIITSIWCFSTEPCRSFPAIHLCYLKRQCFSSQYHNTLELSFCLIGYWSYNHSCCQMCSAPLISTQLCWGAKTRVSDNDNVVIFYYYCIFRWKERQSNHAVHLCSQNSGPFWPLWSKTDTGQFFKLLIFYSL